MTPSPLVQAIRFCSGDLPGLMELFRNAPDDFYRGELWPEVRAEIPELLEPDAASTLLDYADRCKAERDRTS